MMRYILKRAKGVLLALVLLLAAAAGTSSAATYNLCVGQATLALPGSAGVSVWGFGPDTGGQCVPTIPGPTVRVDPTDPVLTVTLRNTLSEPVSLHILGQQLVFNDGPVYEGGRVRSFTTEAAANGGTAIYQWGSTFSPFKPGTYLLQSGTNPAKQVQMGLSAPVIKDAGAGVAYADNLDIDGDQSVPYDREIVLVFQNIDPDIHAAVAAGTYGPGGTITSSAHRDPAYFLINGMAYPAAGLNPVNAEPLDLGERALIRFINAGGDTHVPQILNNYMKMVAEDGVPFKYPQERYGFELNSAKTMDAILVPAEPGSVPVLDGKLNLSNAGAYPGGMLAYIGVAGAVPVTDTVTINSVVHDPVAQTLEVAGISSDQPNVQLTAEGYGALGWKSWLNLYRTTFSGVAARPASVMVTSSGGGSETFTLPTVDTVTVQSVSYSAASGGTLVITATSSDQPNVQLTAAGYGALDWKSWLNLYRNTFTGIGAKPANVTVTSSGGGSATMAVP